MIWHKLLLHVAGPPWVDSFVCKDFKSKKFRVALNIFERSETDNLVGHPVIQKEVICE